MYILRQLIKFNSDHIYRFYKNPGTIETLIEFICKENDFKAIFEGKLYQKIYVIKFKIVYNYFLIYSSLIKFIEVYHV